MKTNLRIGEVLMERNYITQEQMEQALAYQKEHREKRVGQILIELGFVTETQVIEALAARLGLEIVSIGQMQVDLTAVRMIPRELAEKQNLLAVGFADKPRGRDERSAQLLCLRGSAPADRLSGGHPPE